MTDEMKQEIKEWLKENILIEQYNYYYGVNSVDICLRFKDDNMPFTSVYVYIPNENS